MLDIFTLNRPWNWTVCGKHPAAGDYFRLGSEDPILKAFSGWVETGYQKLAHENISNFHAWRFWVKCPQKNTLICGIAQDSSDKLGRHYPLILMGKGILKKWENNWGYLPVVCENIWNKLERLVGGRFTDIRQMEKEILQIQTPKVDWREMTQRKIAEEPVIDIFKNNTCHVKNIIDTLDNQNEIMIPISGELSQAPFAFAEKLHFVLAEHLKTTPNAVFMGGLPNAPRVAIFKRPLKTKDFVRLWSENDNANA